MGMHPHHVEHDRGDARTAAWTIDGENFSFGLIRSIWEWGNGRFELVATVVAISRIGRMVRCVFNTRRVRYPCASAMDESHVTGEATALQGTCAVAAANKIS